jgi:hypothetical protein
MRQGDAILRRYECGHIERKPLEYLNPRAQKEPELLVGARFVCKICERQEKK